MKIVPSAEGTILGLSGIEINLFFDSSGADRTEVVAGEGVHQAVGARTIDAFCHVATAFIDAEFLYIFRVDGGGDRSILVQHVFPFLVEVYEGRYVGFPGFHVGGVHVVVAAADFHVFIC